MLGEARRELLRFLVRNVRVQCAMNQNRGWVTTRYVADRTVGVEPRVVFVWIWAPFRSTKAAIKLHALLDLHGAIPPFIHITDGKTHDVNILDNLIIEPGAYYLLDRRDAGHDPQADKTDR